MSLSSRIRELEKVARRLEPDAEERAALFRAVGHYAETFLESLADRPAFEESDDLGVGLEKAPIGRPHHIETLLEHVAHDVDRPGLNPASGGHLGYIPGGGLYTSALADYLAAVSNRYAGIFFSAPGAVRMENLLIAWMCELVGYPRETAAGNLSSGGSVANLVGIVTARDSAGLKGKDFATSVVYLTGQTHHSVGKALRIAGLGECISRIVPLDEGYRMRAEDLQSQVRDDRAKGLRPFLVIASAGTTDTGVVDPIEDIASVCEREALWLHVDAAYGGFFRLCEEGRKVLGGLERSDSIVMDPHKTLFLPYGSGAVLVRDGKKLFDSHHHLASYMQDTLRTRDQPSPADLSPELTKHFRGLRLWLPLMLHGVEPFRAALQEKMLLARYFRERLMELPRFWVGPEPDLSVVIFRALPPSGDDSARGANAYNEKLVREIHRDGRVFLSSTVLDGRFTLRLAVASFRTHVDTIDLTLEILKKLTQS